MTHSAEFVSHRSRNYLLAALPPEDLARLRKVSESVDDLELWSFGDKS